LNIIGACSVNGLTQPETTSVSVLQSKRKKLSMTKTLSLITEAIRDSKHPFRQADDRPAKPQKSRYERRKIKEIIRLGDWRAEAGA
jgi:hypothetical protein